MNTTADLEECRAPDSAYVAIDDPHFALEPNYYDKAVHWDRTQSEARDSATLGLELTLRQPLTLAADGTLELELRVTDHGPGIPEAYQSLVFQKFEQVRTPNVPRTPGRAGIR